MTDHVDEAKKSPADQLDQSNHLRQPHQPDRPHQPDQPHQRQHRSGGAADRGSITPLIIGMTLCLLFIGLGVTAAGSAFLARIRLQNLCDGATTAAANAIDQAAYIRQGATDRLPIGDAAVARAQAYLAIRNNPATADLSIGNGTINATCTAQAAISFGWLFGNPTLTQQVKSVARPVR